jgi:hypothetical protein
MSADYGGTEIEDALKRVFRARRTDTPTAVFMLTDGEVSKPSVSVASWMLTMSPGVQH